MKKQESPAMQLTFDDLKHCEHCGHSNPSKKSPYCSMQCRDRAKYLRTSERRRELRKDRYYAKPDQAAAHTIARLVPIDEHCHDCGKRARDRHHPSYSAPHIFLSLCRSCHMKRHALERLLSNAQTGQQATQVT